MSKECSRLWEEEAQKWTELDTRLDCSVESHEPPGECG